nr:DUF5632 domain-containing protein [Mycobacterium kansasii]
MMQKQELAQSLRKQREFLSCNEGKTAEDLIARYFEGEQSELDRAEKYKAKAEAFDAGGDAIDYLRTRLTGIADGGNKEIDDVLTSKKPLAEQLAEIQVIQTRCNADAANASCAAVDKIIAATEKVLNAEGVGVDAREWARANGFNLDDAVAPRPVSKDDLDVAPTGPGARASGGSGSLHGTTEPITPAMTGGGSFTGSGVQSASSQVVPPATGGSSWSGSQRPLPISPPPVTTPGMPPGIPAAPGLPGGSFPPAATGQGISPTSLGQSFATGMMTGQPAAGAQSLSAGAMHAMESGATPAPQTASPLPTPPPVAAPTIAAAGIESAAIHPPVDTSATASSTPVMAAGDTGTAAVTPTVVTGAPMSAPVTPAVGPAVPAGPLPAYGSDLRSPVVAAGPTPSAVAAPVSGAPVASSASSSPSAGGPLVSPVERTAAGTTTGGQVGTSGTTMAAAAAASATSGAAAGAVSARTAEQQRLERLVDAVARQEPRLSWAAGLREDGTTTLLVTDLAGGWIPPHIRLPANVTLLEPTARRRDVSVVDLLGAVVAAAAHEPNAYIGAPGPDAPLLSGDRAARSAAPQVDELGPTLVEAVRRRDGLPRIAQAIAAPAVRKTGVLESETQLLRERLTAIQESVLHAYPDHELSALGDWMLMAAIDALIDEHRYLANYHIAWFAVVARREGSGGFAG